MIVAGFGFRSVAEVKSLQSALDAARSDHKIAKLATLEDKAAHPAFQRFAQTAGLAVVAISAQSVRTVQTQTNSTSSFKARQTGSVAEATALLAAGPGAQLIQVRIVSADGMATCALAQSPQNEGDI